MKLVLYSAQEQAAPAYKFSRFVISNSNTTSSEHSCTTLSYSRALYNQPFVLFAYALPTLTRSCPSTLDCIHAIMGPVILNFQLPSQSDDNNY